MKTAKKFLKIDFLKNKSKIVARINSMIAVDNEIVGLKHIWG